MEGDDLVKQEQALLREKELWDLKQKQIQQEFQRVKDQSLDYQIQPSPTTQTTHPEAQPQPQPQCSNPQKNQLLQQIQQANTSITRRQNDRIKELKSKIKKKEDQHKKLTAKTTEIERDRDKLEDIMEAKVNVIKDMEEKGTILSEDSRRLVAQVKKAYQGYQHDKKNLQRVNNQLLTLETQYNKLQNEIGKLSFLIETAKAEGIKKDQKCQKAQIELTSCKTDNKEKAMLSAQDEESMRKANQKLFSENKRLERQKQELLTTFRKIEKLIVLLQKQKGHLQLLPSLDMTEKEFMKAVDIAE